MPEHREPTINAKPVENALPATRGRGRPPRIQQPPLPQMEMSEQEHAMQTFFIESYRLDYPDMLPTDLILLQLASFEYIKYLRVVQEELATGKVISMARQHPGVNMRALLDQMSVTRRARNSGSRQNDTNKDDQELRDALMSIGEN